MPENTVDRTDKDDPAARAPKVRAVVNAVTPELVRDEVMELMQTRFGEFLADFSSMPEGGTDLGSMAGSASQGGSARHYRDYVMQAETMVAHDTTTLYVDWKHLMDFDAELGEVIELEYFRFEPCLRDAVRSFVGTEHPEYIWDSEDAGRGEKRDFFVSFFDLPCIERIRALKTDRIGRLLSVSGTVTRTSEVRPELLAGTFTCGKCGRVEALVPQQFQYTPPLFCRNPACNSSHDFVLDMARSRFVDWQRVKVQENADEIPAGSMPRSIDVILRHEIVEKAKAGDKSVFTGMLVVIPDSPGRSRGQGEATLGARGDSNAGVRAKDTGQGFGGLKKLGVRELTYRTVFIASGVQPLEVRTGVHNVRDAPDGPENLASEFTQEERDEILRMAEMPGLYQKMVESIAPAVFGHQWVKRGVLLMLLGGVHKRTPEGIKLRGDINTCIVGDPSTAKSQFLKYVHGFLPRAVYTSGKASSAAGLTASVGKDPETGEFCVDAGALMLADNGICCIDEFDKMDAADQVAIHEAMEQQTISITKAGIQATLNARTSILAAANPKGGRYDRSKSLKANVELTAPIMSRFDMFFVVLDECDEASDLHIAQHILACHRRKAEALEPPFRTDQLQRYIRYARAFDPQIKADGARVLVDCYRQLRQQDSLGRNRSCYRITVRQLESLIRLSEALARLHLDDEVRPRYVLEAHRLLKTSIIHVEADDVVLDDELDDDGTHHHGNAPRGSGSGGGGGGGSGGGGGGDDDDDDGDEFPLHTKGLDALPSGGARGRGGEGDADEQPGASPAAAPTQRRQVVISNEKFKEIASMIGRHLGQCFDRGQTEGVRWDEVVTWYLEQRVDDLETEEAFDAEKDIANKVIRKLLAESGTLVYMGMPSADAPEDETLIALHPGIDPRTL